MGAHQYPLREALWEVIDELPVERKRGLLKFITGVDRLPEAGAEFLTVELPFAPELMASGLTRARWVGWLEDERYHNAGWCAPPAKPCH